MQVGPMQYLELKYCERCGTLRLRSTGSSRIYCTSCEGEMENVRRVARREQPPETGSGSQKSCPSIERSWLFASAGHREDPARRCL